VSVLTWLGFPGDAAAWSTLAFDVTGDSFLVGTVACSVGVEPSWGFDEIRVERDLGVDTDVRPPNAPGPGHPNGIDRIDHIVYTVPDLDEAVENLTAFLGMPPRRRFHPRGPDGPEMAFFRVGEGFIEVVSSGRPAELTGIAFSSPDLDATVKAIRDAGGPIGDPKPAVQGGRIASVWREHVHFPVAVMEPPKK
jgi:catechol 2,3-dioxygenase-like lactoylglutathione lyase family enzyme